MYKIALISVILLIPWRVNYAHSYALPADPSHPPVVGQWQLLNVKKGDTLAQIANAHGVSMHALMAVNPKITNRHKITPGQGLLLPTCYQLPTRHRQGIVVNLSAQALYYFPPNESTVFIAPITIGKPSTPTPVGTFKVMRKRIDPTWYPPASIRKDYAKRGISLPDSVPPGQNNPLGKYIFYLNTAKQWIHTAATLGALGGARSYGCIRVYESDMEALYPQVPVNTPVHIIKEPVDKKMLAKYC